ncbi:uncharacterized protein LOC133396919 isoform X2 [Phycodurus eques]|uniref:uncharacterized protein LOC133396919 isoform X2 n=1 Tax=Phycodurus eques TaxID=693459 RepID=UPI002ACE19D3|nr:uncharacterized protein LOC133396919 isoform X2 [Phycodurus eques]
MVNFLSNMLRGDVSFQSKCHRGLGQQAPPPAGRRDKFYMNVSWRSLYHRGVFRRHLIRRRFLSSRSNSFCRRLRSTVNHKKCKWGLCPLPCSSSFRGQLSYKVTRCIHDTEQSCTPKMFFLLLPFIHKVLKSNFGEAGDLDPWKVRALKCLHSTIRCSLIQFFVFPHFFQSCRGTLVSFPVTQPCECSKAQKTSRPSSSLVRTPVLALVTLADHFTRQR